MADFRLTKPRKEKPPSDETQAGGIRLSRRAEKQPRAAREPLSPEASRSLFSHAGGAAMSSLHTIGSILSTPSRVLWGTVNGLTGGEGGFGNMNPLDSTGGIELSHVLGNAGVIAKNNPHAWEWSDVGRGLVDIAGDPTTWLTPLGLTKAGIAASKQGTLTGSKVSQIARGQRGLVGARIPFAAEGRGAIGTGRQVAYALSDVGQRTGISDVADAVVKSAPVTAAKQMFHASSLGRSTHATQRAAEGAYHETTRGLQDVDLGTINAARNMEARGLIPGDTERHLAELGRPTAEMGPVVAAKNALHGHAQSLGIPTGDLDNTVKMHTKIGPKRAAKTHVLDEYGNISHTIDNIVSPTAKDVGEVNFLAPNQRTEHFPRFAGEGVEWGNFGGDTSRKAMSASSTLNQKRNEDLLGNAASELIEKGIRSASGAQPRLASAGFTANQQDRIIGKLIKKAVIKDDIAAGTNLTKKFADASGREMDRTRELGQFVRANPQLAETGLFTNHPLQDAHRQMSSLVDTTEKAKAAINFMAQHGRLTHSEPLDVLRANRLNNPPTVREAAEQLGLQRDRVAEHVLPSLPREVSDQLSTAAVKRATTEVTHELTQRIGKMEKAIKDMTSSGMDTVDEKAFNRLYSRYQDLMDNLDSHIDSGVAKRVPDLMLKGVQDLHLPAKEYQSLTGFLDTPAPSGEGWLSSLNTMWKANMLAHPATQVRNAGSGVFTNLMESAVGPKSTKKAVDLLRGKDVSGYGHIPEVDRLAKSQNISETEAIRRLAGVYFPKSNSIAGDLPPGQVGTQLADMTSNVPGRTELPLSEMVAAPARALMGYRDGQHVGWNAIRPDAIGGAWGRETTDFAPAMASNVVAGSVEQANRLSPWLGMMDQGYSAAEAARRVGKAQVNYGPREFSEFEKKIKKVIPFYSFTSRAGKHVAGELASDPGGRLAQFTKMQSRSHSSDPSIPDSVMSGTAMPLPEGPDGTKRFITGFGLQHEPIVHTLGAIAGGNVRGALYDLAGMTNPLIKTPAEYMTGQSFYQRGEPSQNLESNIGRTLANIGVMAGTRDKDAGPVDLPGLKALDMAVGASPLSRYASTARTLTDQRKSIGERIANTASGVRITDVSPKKQTYELMKKAERLAKDSGAHVRSDVYFSKKEIEKLQTSNPSLARKQQELQAMLNSLNAKSSKKEVSTKKTPKIKLGKKKKPSTKVKGLRFQKKERQAA